MKKHHPFLGECFGVESQVRTRTPCYFIHVMMPEAGTTYHQNIPQEFTAFLYTLGGCGIQVVGGGGGNQSIDDAFFF